MPNITKKGGKEGKERKEEKDEFDEKADMGYMETWEYIEKKARREEEEAKSAEVSLAFAYLSVVELTKQKLSADDALVELINIFPKMCRSHAFRSIYSSLEYMGPHRALQTEVDRAIDKGYPRPEPPAPEPGAAEKYGSKLYRSWQRRGEGYKESSISTLLRNFPALSAGR